MSGNSELDKYIEATGESINIDAKGPVSWDGGCESASLAKDMAAFANSRDGGVLVIGRAESSPGVFENVGLSEAEADSFDTTKVANWVNARFSPSINLVCHQHEYDGKRFVVITIEEFDDIPVLCTKSYQPPSDPKNHIIRKNAIYVRTTNAESAPLKSVEELRTLIGLATKKRTHDLLATFDAMLKGRPLVSVPTSDEKYVSELQEIERELGEEYAKLSGEGAWKMIVRPATYVQERWNTIELLEAVVRRRSVRLRSEFPASLRGTHMRAWGVCNDMYGYTWTLTKSGQFICMRPYRENKMPFDSPWRTLDGEPSEPSLAPGRWLDFIRSMFEITEMYMFASRMTEEYVAEQNMHICIEATDLSERRLMSSYSRVDVCTDPCRASRFVHKEDIKTEDLKAGWEQLCAVVMKSFCDHFPDFRVEASTMSDWIERFKNREFS